MTTWTFDSDLDGWVLTYGPDTWDAATYHNASGSIYFDPTEGSFGGGYMHQARSPEVDVTAHVGDSVSVWFYAATVYGDGRDAKRKLSIGFEFSDSSYDVSYFTQYTGIPLDTWTQYTWTLNPANAGKTIKYIYVSYFGMPPYDDPGHVKGWLDDVVFTSGVGPTSFYVQKTEDAGAGWANITPSAGGVAVRRGLHIDDLDKQHITALIQNAPTTQRVYQSLNNGAAWSEMETTDLHGAVAIGRWPFNSTSIYFGDAGHWFWSLDNGVTLLDKTGDWGSFSNPSNIVPCYLGGGI